jgi:hypothetical protein
MHSRFCPENSVFHRQCNNKRGGGVLPPRLANLSLFGQMALEAHNELFYIYPLQLSVTSSLES